jgi:hypothetical protein
MDRIGLAAASSFETPLSAALRMRKKAYPHGEEAPQAPSRTMRPMLLPHSAEAQNDPGHWKPV